MRHVSIQGKRVPAVMVAVLLVVAGAGAATGIAFSGAVDGEFVTLVDQSILIAPEGTGIFLSSGADGAVTISDDNASFRVAAAIHQGDSYEINIDLKNRGEAGTAGRLVLHAPDPIQLEIRSERFTNLETARLDRNTWMFSAEKSIGAPLTTTNPWTGPVCNPHIVGFNDTPGDAGGVNLGVETWNPTFENDIIVHDIGGNGTISDSADTVINDEGVPNRDNCDPLLQPDVANLSAKAWYVELDGNSGYNTSDEVFIDNDSDGKLTNQADPTVGGTAPAAGTNVTTEGAQDGDWSIDSFDDTDGDSWDGSNDFLGFDDDDDGVYTSTGDTVINDEGTDNRDVGDDLVSVGSSARFFDKDGSGGYNTSDEIYLDDDSDDVYTGQADTQLAGITLGGAGAGTGLTASNPWSGATKAVMFNDAGTTNLWESGSDVIVVDDDEDDVYTSGSDTLVDADGTSSSGSGSAAAISAGDPLVSTEPADNLCTDSLTSPSQVFIDSGGDCDVDDGDIHTPILGSLPGGGSSGTPDATPVDSNWAINEDATADGAYTDGDDLYIENIKDELTYSAGKDTTLAGSAPGKGTALTATNPFTTAPQVAFADDPGGVSDGVWEAGSDVIVTDPHNGGTISTAADTIVSRGDDGTTDVNDGVLASDNDFDESTYLAVDDGNDGFDVGTDDDIVRDDGGSGTFSDSADTPVGGTTPNNGDPYTDFGAFDSDWSLDSIDAADGGDWDGSSDTIIIDVGDRGTYSADADAAVSLGNDSDRDGADGATLLDLDETTFLVVDDDDDDSIDLGTEDDIVTDDDRDGLYTSQADVKLAGQVALATLNGETITTTNPWDDPPDFHPNKPHGPNDPTVHHPVTFFDDGDGAWEADQDSIYLDRWNEDRIVSYKPEDDILLAGTEYGDLVIVVALPDDAAPGFYTIEGKLEPTET